VALEDYTEFLAAAMERKSLVGAQLGCGFLMAISGIYPQVNIY
jgi:hypothetical protein